MLFSSATIPYFSCFTRISDTYSTFLIHKPVLDDCTYPLTIEEHRDLEETAQMMSDIYVLGTCASRIYNDHINHCDKTHYSTITSNMLLQIDWLEGAIDSIFDNENYTSSHVLHFLGLVDLIF